MASPATQDHRTKGARGNTPIYVAMVVTMIVTLIVSFAAQKSVSSNQRDQIRDYISTGLEITHEAAGAWVEQQHRMTKTWAESDILAALVSDQLGVAPTREALLASPSHLEIGALLGTPVAAMRFLSFVVVDHDGLIVSSSHPEDVGTHWGDSHPVAVLEHTEHDDDLHLVVDESPHSGSPAEMWFSHLITDSSEEQIATLIFSADPSRGFTSILQRGRLGLSGETFAFDASGRLISDTRFNDQTEATGLVQEGESVILSVSLLDPGVNLLTGEEGAIPVDERPFTLLASEALAGRSGDDFSGFRDYRGVTVVGVWLWDDALQLGFGSKVDEAEAFLVRGQVNRTIGVSTAIALVLIAAMAAVFLRIRRQQEKRLSAEARHRAITTAATDGIVSADGNGTIQSWNPAAEAMFQYPAEQLVGTESLTIIMPERFRDGYLARLKGWTEGIEQKVTEPMHSEGKRRDGTEFPIELTLGTVAEDNGGMLHTAIIRDATDRVAAEDEKQEQQANLEALISSKDQLIASVSHELRTPLTSIIGFTELLLTERDTLSTDDLSEMIQTVAAESTDLAGIVEDLLVAARTDLENVPIRLEPIDLGALTQASLKRLSASDPSSTLPVSGSAMAFADPNRVRQIIRNLVTNVRRYGGPTAHIEVGQNGQWSSISVHDNGEPVASEDQDLLFEPYGLSGANKPNRQSVGLGLSVSRRLANLMGGTLVYRHDGAESIFELSLPAHGESPHQDGS